MNGVDALPTAGRQQLIGWVGWYGIKNNYLNFNIVVLYYCTKTKYLCGRKIPSWREPPEELRHVLSQIGGTSLKTEISSLKGIGQNGGRWPIVYGIIKGVNFCPRTSGWGKDKSRQRRDKKSRAKKAEAPRSGAGANSEERPAEGGERRANALIIFFEISSNFFENVHHFGNCGFAMWGTRNTPAHWSTTKWNFKSPESSQINKK